MNRWVYHAQAQIGLYVCICVSNDALHSLERGESGVQSSAFASKHPPDFPQRGVARQTGNNPAQPRIANRFVYNTDTLSKWVAKQYSRDHTV